MSIVLISLCHPPADLPDEQVGTIGEHHQGDNVLQWASCACLAKNQLIPPQGGVAVTQDTARGERFMVFTSGGLTVTLVEKGPQIALTCWCRRICTPQQSS